MKKKPGPGGIYLDNAATSYPKPEEVYRAVEHYMRVWGGTAARGQHPRAMEAGRVTADCRRRIQRLLGAASGYRLAFTSGATESLNLAIKGLLKRGAHVVINDLEHNSVIRPLATLKRERGVSCTVVRSRDDGTLDPAEIRKAIRPKTQMIVCTHASNVLGTLVDIRAIAKIARRKRILFLVDAAQTTGVIPINTKGWGIDLLAFTGHKGLFGPPGTGGLLFREKLDVAPLKEGGTGILGELLEQPNAFPERYESGSQNLYGFAGLAAGVECLERMGVPAIRKKKIGLVRFLHGELAKIPGVTIYGSQDPSKSCGIVAFNVGRRSAIEVGDLLWRRGGVMVRSGLHCAPLLHRRHGTMKQGMVRVGIGFKTTREHLRILAETIRRLA